MNAPNLKLVPTRAMRIDRALEALVAVIGDTTIPLNARQDAVKAHASLHVCRSTETVARLEREKGLR